MTLLNVEYTKNTYGDTIDAVLNRMLLSLPYFLSNSVDILTTNDCCLKLSIYLTRYTEKYIDHVIFFRRLLTLIKTLQSQESFHHTMISALVCVGIASNDNHNIIRKFKVLKADVLINGTYNCFLSVRVSRKNSDL